MLLTKPLPASVDLRPLKAFAHAAISQYYGTISSIRSSPIDSTYTSQQLEWALNAALNANFSSAASKDEREIRDAVENYLRTHLCRIETLGSSLRDYANDYLFPLCTDRPFCLRTSLTLGEDSIWLRGQVDVLWLDKDYGGLLIEEIKATSWRGRFYQESHGFQAVLYYYLVKLEQGLNPVKAVRLTYLQPLKTVDINVTQSYVRRVQDAIIEVAKGRMSEN